MQQRIVAYMRQQGVAITDWGSDEPSCGHAPYCHLSCCGETEEKLNVQKTKKSIATRT